MNDRTDAKSGTADPTGPWIIDPDGRLLRLVDESEVRPERTPPEDTTPC